MLGIPRHQPPHTPFENLFSSITIVLSEEGSQWEVTVTCKCGGIVTRKLEKFRRLKRSCILHSGSKLHKMYNTSQCLRYILPSIPSFWCRWEESQKRSVSGNSQGQATHDSSHPTPRSPSFAAAAAGMKVIEFQFE